MKLTDSLRNEYESLFASARITNPGAVKWAVDRVQRNFARYEAVEEKTGVPACVIAVLHCLEASFDFGSHLHNGDPLTARTVQVPAGRPKTGSAPFTWEESALDALQYDGALTVKEWNIATALHFLEMFNGSGYRTGAGRATTPPMRSPYLWSMTQHYVKGKYVADGKWDSNAVSAQVGACALLLAMMQRGLPVFEEEPTEEPKPVPTSTGRPYAPCPVPVPWNVDLSRGDSKTSVYWLQCALIGLGYLRKPADGELVGDVFNEHVEWAVKRLQTDHMLGIADGIVGSRTRAHIEILLNRARAPKPPVDNNVATLKRDGIKTHSGAWSGLSQLILTVGDAEFFVASGAIGRQVFRKADSPHSVPGSLEPIPQGIYRFDGQPEFVDELDSYEGSWGSGLGPVWHGLENGQKMRRGAFGVHLDSNIGTARGSAGCIVFQSISELRRYVAAWRKARPKTLSVEWGL